MGRREWRDGAAFRIFYFVHLYGRGARPRARALWGTMRRRMGKPRLPEVWIPAFAGMTAGAAGMTAGAAGMAMRQWE